MKITPAFILALLLSCSAFFMKAQTIKNVFDLSKTQQQIHSFGASDCWRTQYVGQWPDEKKKAIAQLLFSKNKDSKGNPVGIGLSLWRFNIGSGTHEGANGGGIRSPWRRTECFMDETGSFDWSKQKGQRWFLDEARRLKVKYTLGFSIAAPVFLSKNGLGHASKEQLPHLNICDSCMREYAHFMVKVSGKLKLDYISPINEPQWDWTSASQEGTPATNEECRQLVELLNEEIVTADIPTKIVFGEAADIRFLYGKNGKPFRDNQITDVFNFIKELPHVAKIVSGHSYWSTWPLNTLKETRIKLKEAMQTNLPKHEYWQTEYCPMEKNNDNPNGGGKRDVGIDAALYVARVIHHDLVYANSSSWQWWTAFSEWDYKDGLIYIDDGIQENGATKQDDSLVETCKKDGVFRTSKLLWALGNYSHFIRPGMYRIQQDNLGVESELYISAYTDKCKKQIVAVVINDSNEAKQISLEMKNCSLVSSPSMKWNMYETSQANNLGYIGRTTSELINIPARSIITLTNVGL